MNFLSSHPLTIGLAIVSGIIWSAGRYYRKGGYVVAGVVFSIAAIVAFVLEY